MASNSQRSERAKVSPVAERNQAEWYNHKQNSFFMHVPAKQEGGVAAQSNCANERFPRWLVQKTQKNRLYIRQYCSSRIL